MAKVVSGSGDATARIWDTATGQALHVIHGDVSPIFVVKWSPDGIRIVGGDLEGVLRVWNAATGQQLTTIQGSLGPIIDVEWSPDSVELAYSGPSRMIHIVDVSAVEFHATATPVRER